MECCRLLVCLFLVVVSGIGLDDISSNTELFRQYSALPEPVKADTQKILLNIPRTDIEHINIDTTGQIYYREPTFHDHIEQIVSSGNISLPEFFVNMLRLNVETDTSFTQPIFDNITWASTPKFHSRPGSTNVIYLDFDGETVSGRAWNSGATFACLPFDIDGNPNDVSAEELNRIRDIWERVSEDFSIWDVDVTTERPSVFTQTTAHALITVGNTITPSGTIAGGIAYLNVFGVPYYHFYSPAFVYYNNLINGNPKFVAEAVSHEIGHNLGLSHDGTNTVSYYSGHGTGSTGWAPIMGVGYAQPITQWSKGEYPNANNLEDDLAIITSKIQRIPLPQNYLRLGANSSCNFYYTGSSRVRYSNEMTSWDFSAYNRSSITVRVTPYQSTWNSNPTYRGNNLDAVLIIIKDWTVLDYQQPSGTADIVLTRDVEAGQYLIAVGGSGDPTIPFSSYGSLGQYNIDLCVKSRC